MGSIFYEMFFMPINLFFVVFANVNNKARTIFAICLQVFFVIFQFFAIL